MASQLVHVYNLKSDDSVISGFAYEYDPVGNRTSVLESGGDRVTWTYDAGNRLTPEQRSGASGYDTTYTYDLAGNLHVARQPTGARTTTTWDDQNRQIGVVQPAGGITTCTYRFDGLRHSKGASGGATKFIWDYENYLAEADDQNEIQAVYTNEPQQYGNLISQYRKGRRFGRRDTTSTMPWARRGR